MRNPLRKAGYCLTLGVVGAGCVVLVTYEYSRLGDVAGAIIGVVGLTVAIFSFVFLVISLLAAIGHARLMSGVGLVARWHVTAAEWDRFRAFDAIRAQQDHTLVNDLRIRKRTPADGVDVIVGRRQLIVDGSYQALRGLPTLSAVYWLPAPADPECLEFALLYPRGRYGGTRQLSLRVPVPAAAREDGLRVFQHYRALIPTARVGIAYRRPKLVIGWGLGVACVAAIVGGVCWILSSRSERPGVADILAIVGTMVAIGALLFTAIIALAVSQRKK